MEKIKFSSMYGKFGNNKNDETINCTFSTCFYWKDGACKKNKTDCSKLRYAPKHNYDYSKGSYVVAKLDKHGNYRYSLFDENDIFMCNTSEKMVVLYNYKVYYDE